MTALLTGNLPLLAGAPNVIKKLRELILELAVRGKLVPQDPNDEPASELLKRTAEEKARLVSERRIKKQKVLPEISEEEVPFHVPTSWEWVRLGDSLEMINGRAFKPSDWKGAGVPIVRIQNLNRMDAPFNYCEESDVDDRHIIDTGTEVSPHFFLRDQALVASRRGRRCAHGARFKVTKPEKSANHARQRSIAEVPV
ncbi:hypothetical protein ACQR53_04475 [Xanthomonas oryzae]|uniref:hypothetical protein n=1 Tax=Xanthomonas oryzae TaxID=347 RepID=UPI003D185383